LKVDIELFFGTKKEEEVLISEIFYKANYNGPYLGVIDAYISLIQGKPVEASDRFPIKELDYFLRDNSSEPAFTAYSQEIYEIIGIGEKIKDHVFGKKEDVGFVFDQKNEFSDLSSSEQYEVIEELLSFYFYKKGVDIDAIECDDIDFPKMKFICSEEYRLKLAELVKNQIDNSLLITFS
jgi:hypothetical protein